MVGSRSPLKYNWLDLEVCSIYRKIQYFKDLKQQSGYYGSTERKLNFLSVFLFPVTAYCKYGIFTFFIFLSQEL